MSFGRFMKDATNAICPVDETGRNSVIPSTIARMMTCMRSISILWLLHDGKELDHITDKDEDRGQRDVLEVENGIVEHLRIT